MVIKKQKRIYSNSGFFELKSDPNDWSERDVDYMAGIILKAVGKHPITMITYQGIHQKGTVSMIKNGRVIPNKRHAHWTNDHIGQYMLFDLHFEKKVPRTTRKSNLNDIIMQLLIECI